MNFRQQEDLQEAQEKEEVIPIIPGSDFMNMLGIGSTPESVIIKGQDFTRMKKLADDIKSTLNALSSVGNAGINVQDNKPEVRSALRHGLYRQKQSDTHESFLCFSTFGREYSSGATFREGTENYDIMIKYAGIPMEII